MHLEIVGEFIFIDKSYEIIISYKVLNLIK